MLAIVCRQHSCSIEYYQYALIADAIYDFDSDIHWSTGITRKSDAGCDCDIN